MAYVLRPHKGNDNLDGWDDSVKYDKTAIKSIEDPNGGAASIPITSIPSPFASMELVRNAFEYCADRNNSVDGTSVYHKLVLSLLTYSKFSITMISTQKILISFHGTRMI